MLASWVTGDMLFKWGFPSLTMVTGSNSGWELCGSACQRGYRVGGGLGTLVVPKRELGGGGAEGGPLLLVIAF